MGANSRLGAYSNKYGIRRSSISSFCKRAWGALKRIYGKIIYFPFAGGGRYGIAFQEGGCPMAGRYPAQLFRFDAALLWSQYMMI